MPPQYLLSPCKIRGSKARACLWHDSVFTGLLPKLPRYSPANAPRFPFLQPYLTCWGGFQRRNYFAAAATKFVSLHPEEENLQPSPHSVASHLRALSLLFSTFVFNRSPQKREREILALRPAVGSRRLLLPFLVGSL